VQREGAEAHIYVGAHTGRFNLTLCGRMVENLKMIARKGASRL
jgi:hypothetical protein